MANTRYYLAEIYKHHRTGDFPLKIGLDTFPVCRICKKDIYVDDINKEWACSDLKCLLR